MQGLHLSVVGGGLAPPPSPGRCHRGRRPTVAESSASRPSFRSVDRPAAAHSGSKAIRLCDAVEGMISRFLDPAELPRCIDPRLVLAGNFAPVPELPPTPCRVVKGAIPGCLRGGAYVRNGPNPVHPPRAPYHVFDGDGMLHSLLLPVDGGGCATFCSRYVRTQRYEVERRNGSPALLNFFGLHGVAGLARIAVLAMRVLSGQMNVTAGVSPGNVSLSYFHERLFALGELDCPYAVHLSPEDGELTAVDRQDFTGDNPGGMGAHPWVDPDTGEVFALRSSIVPPFLTYVRFDSGGRKQTAVQIRSLRRLRVVHGFAVTGRYAIIPATQMVVDPLAMALRGGSLFRTIPAEIPRIGILPRYAESAAELTWLDTPGLNPLHIVNAWDDGDDVVLLVSNTLNMQHLVGRIELVHGQMEMVRIELRRTPVISRTPLSAMNLDLGTVNPAYRGRRSRYCYLSVAGEPPRIRGVAKLDLELARQRRECTVAFRDYGDGCFGGEPFFVPEERAEGDDGVGEDEGYLVAYIHDEKKEESKFVVMDARSPELETVAEVLLPGRVPYGFHGIFLSGDELRRQKWPR